MIWSAATKDLLTSGVPGARLDDLPDCVTFMQAKYSRKLVQVVPCNGFFGI